VSLCIAGLGFIVGHLRGLVLIVLQFEAICRPQILDTRKVLEIVFDVKTRNEFVMERNDVIDMHARRSPLVKLQNLPVIGPWRCPLNL